MGRTHGTRPRRAKTSFHAELLESRALLTGGAGSVFATMPASVTKAGQTVSLPFTITPQLFTVPHGKMVLGIDVSAQQYSTITPSIVAVQDAKGHLLHITHGTYTQAVSTSLQGKTQTSAILVDLGGLPRNSHGKPAKFTVDIQGLNETTGDFTVAFYLPGDVNGTGDVTKADLKTIKSDIGTQYGASNYAIDADSNRNGEVTSSDLNTAQQNLGVKTLVNPNVNGSLDSSVITNTANNSTSATSIGFSGTATPGATVVISQLEGKEGNVTTTANSSGQFSTALPLTQGSNTFSVTVTDPFGQINAGAMLPVNRVPAS